MHQNYDTIMSIVKLHHDYVQSQFPNNTIFGTFLFGSQNYLMDDENSDVDTISIVIPNSHDLVKNCTIRDKYINLPLCNKKDQITVWDIREMYKMLEKGALVAAEALSSMYFIYDKSCTEDVDRLRKYLPYYINAHLRNFLVAINGNINSYIKKFTANPIFDEKSYYNILRLFCTANKLISRPTNLNEAFYYENNDPIDLSKDRTIYEVKIANIITDMESLIYKKYPKEETIIQEVVENCLRRSLEKSKN